MYIMCNIYIQKTEFLFDNLVNNLKKLFKVTILPHIGYPKLKAFSHS